jgi:hypothetical protein
MVREGTVIPGLDHFIATAIEIRAGGSSNMTG